MCDHHSRTGFSLAGTDAPRLAAWVRPVQGFQGDWSPWSQGAGRCPAREREAGGRVRQRSDSVPVGRGKRRAGGGFPLRVSLTSAVIVRGLPGALMLLLAGPLFGASETERQALLDVRQTQARAVLAFNETLMTAQALRRARAYLAQWHRRAVEGPEWPPGELAALDGRLRLLEERFLHLYQAHFGKTKDRKRNLVPLTMQARQLTASPSARNTARELFVQDCQADLDACTQALRAYRRLLAETRASAETAVSFPESPATPAFTDKPPATLRPDGTPTGLIFGIGTDDPNVDHPVTALLGGDFDRVLLLVGKDGSISNTPIAGPASRARQAQVVIGCAFHQQMYCSRAWFDENRDKEIFRSNVTRDWDGYWGARLDFYEPTVRSMLADYLQQVGRICRDDARVLMYTTAWEPELNDTHDGLWGRWPTGGRTAAAVQAFREYLRDKFGTIEQLNKAWPALYEDFAAIVPPPDIWHGPEPARTQLAMKLSSGACPPLYYEFNRFLKDSYADYLSWCYKQLKMADPTHPVSVSPSYGSIDGYLCGGRDSFRWAADCCDVYGSEGHSTLEEVFNWSVQRALNRTTGICEYIWNGPENWSNPPEDVVRAAASRNLWRLVAWGRTLFTLYGSIDTYGGGAFNNMLVFESGYNLLRRSAGIIAPLKRKLRSMEDVWLTAAVAEPHIAVLKPSASQICGWPTDPEDAVTQVTRNLHDLLYSRHYHYAFVPEEYLLSGQDQLERYRLLILPYATHFPPGLTEKILPWVREGGTLIIAGIAGGFTPYGAKDGTLMREVFGNLSYRPAGEFCWQTTVDAMRTEVRDIGQRYAETFLASFGQGRVLMATRAQALRPGGSAADWFYRLVDQAAPRPAWAEGAELEMVLRHSARGLHLTLINPDVKREARATIRLAQAHGLAVDRGMEGGFPVPLRKDGKGQAFDIWLAPGEGTVIDLLSP